MKKGIDKDSWEYKFAEIKKTRPKDFQKAYRMNWGVHKRMVDFMYALYLHYCEWVRYVDSLEKFYDSFHGCIPCEVCGERDMAQRNTWMNLSRVNGFVDAMRLSGIGVEMVVDSVIVGFPVLGITVLPSKED